jgi:hypothetical protein
LDAQGPSYRGPPFFPELNEPARPAAAQPASRDASRPAPGGASALRTERRRRIEDPAATYLPGLATVTADSTRLASRFGRQATPRAEAGSSLRIGSLGGEGMRTRLWTRRSGGTLKRGAAARGEAAGPKAAQGRAAAAVSSRMPEWGSRLVAGSPDRCSRGRERIPSSILDGEKLWKGERRKQRTRASVRVGARSACGGAAGSVARVSVTRGVAAGCAGAGGSPQGSDRSLAGAQKAM